MQKSERQSRREEPMPEIRSGGVPEESLAASKPHITPAASTKSKQPRKASSTSLKRKRANVEKGMERSQKLEKRRSSVEGKKDGKQRAKLLWD